MVVVLNELVGVVVELAEEEGVEVVLGDVVKVDVVLAEVDGLVVVSLVVAVVVTQFVAKVGTIAESWSQSTTVILPITEDSGVRRKLQPSI